MIYNPRKRSRACNGSVGLRARNHVKSDLDTFIFISLANCQRFVRHRPKLKNRNEVLSFSALNSNADYRSSAIIQGATNALTDILRLCQIKRKRGLFSTKQKDVHANAFMIKYPTILYHGWRTNGQDINTEG